MIVTDIKNGVTLTKVIEKAVEKTMSKFTKLSGLSDKKIVVNVIDLTCNDMTDGTRYPDIEFIGPPN
jgi:hypothetical protein